MNPTDAIALLVRTAAGAPAADLVLRAGDVVVARVVQAPGPDGSGLLSLAGSLQGAKLPHGVRAGQKLRLEVQSAAQDTVVLKLVRGPEQAPVDTGRAAGSLAVRGDGDLLRGAIALAGNGQPLLLPDGRAAQVRVEDEAPSARREGRSAATVVLHSPDLGPIELRVEVGPGAVAAAVRVEPGRATELADAGARELARALERASARRASVGVSTRADGEPRPEAPRPHREVFERYA